MVATVALIIYIPLLVLGLGLCFFAGGTRFSEQGFGISEFIYEFVSRASF